MPNGEESKSLNGFVCTSKDTHQPKKMKGDSIALPNIHRALITKPTVNPEQLASSQRQMEVQCNTEKYTPSSDDSKDCATGNDIIHISGDGNVTTHHPRIMYVDPHSEEVWYLASLCESLPKESSDLSKSAEAVRICIVCSDELKSLGELRSHIAAHSADKTLKCQICGVILDGLDLLSKHMKSHNDDDFCDKRENSSKHRKKHSKRGADYSCMVCDQEFNNEASLGRHMRVHVGEKPYKCDICHEGFNHFSSHNKHMKKHSGEKTTWCDICDKSFNNADYLNTHMRIHTGEKPYICPSCGKGFIQSGALVRHKRTHTGEKPFKCEICGKGFSQTCSVRTHMRIHTGEKPFMCTICSQGFVQSVHLTVHMKKYHSNVSS